MDAKFPVRKPRLRYLLPGLLLVLFAFEKLDLEPTTRNERMADGIYYFQIAEHVADGDGLRTSVSLYGQGLRDMPSPATVQPLWPLVLGYSGRVLGMDRAAHWIPELLYFVSLILIYFVANRLGRALQARDLLSYHGGTLLDLGTLAIALLGSNAVYSAYTSKAYTEGLGFSLFFGCLLALPHVGLRRLLFRSAAAGALAGLAYLSRSQFVLVPIALVIVLGLLQIRDRRLRHAWLASAVGSLAVVLPWIGFLFHSLETVPLRVLIDFSAYRENDALSPAQLTVPLEGPIDRVLDLIHSLIQAFHPFSGNGYPESFGPIVYAIPVALGLFGWHFFFRSSTPERARETSDIVLPVSFVLVAVSLAPVHLAHMSFGREWLFAWRHGLPLVLAIVLAVAYLWRFGRVMRGVLLVGLVAGTLLRTSVPERFIVAGDRGPSDPEKELVAWIDNRPRPPVVLGYLARWLTVWSQAVTHVPVCTNAKGLEEQIRAIEPDYVVIAVSEFRICPALREIDPRVLTLKRRFGRGAQSILLWQPMGSPDFE
jgi:hypothetical protein